MSHLPTVAVDGADRPASWNNRRLERPDPPRLSHDGPGLGTTPAARGAMTKAILAKDCTDLPPFRVSSLEPPHPSSIRLPQCRRRLTEDHIRLQGDKPLRQHLRPPGSARRTAKPECGGKKRVLSLAF